MMHKYSVWAAAVVPRGHERNCPEDLKEVLREEGLWLLQASNLEKKAKIISSQYFVPGHSVQASGKRAVRPKSRAYAAT